MKFVCLIPSCIRAIANRVALNKFAFNWDFSHFKMATFVCFSFYSLFAIFVEERKQFLMNDLPVTGYPCYAQRTLGSPGGKHCKSLEGIVWRKVVSTCKKTILGRDQRFFAVVLSKMDLGNVDTWKM